MNYHAKTQRREGLRGRGVRWECGADHWGATGSNEEGHCLGALGVVQRRSRAFPEFTTGSSLRDSYELRDRDRGGWAKSFEGRHGEICPVIRRGSDHPRQEPGWSYLGKGKTPGWQLVIDPKQKVGQGISADVAYGLVCGVGLRGGYTVYAIRPGPLAQGAFLVSWLAGLENEQEEAGQPGHEAAKRDDQSLPVPHISTLPRRESDERAN